MLFELTSVDFVFGLRKIKLSREATKFSHVYSFDLNTTIHNLAVQKRKQFLQFTKNINSTQATYGTPRSGLPVCQT